MELDQIWPRYGCLKMSQQDGKLYIGAAGAAASLSPHGLPWFLTVRYIKIQLSATRSGYLMYFPTAMTIEATHSAT